MHSKISSICVVLAVLLSSGCALKSGSHGVIIESPTADQIVTSPLLLRGLVPGRWAFESTFPVLLQDPNGLILAQGNARLGNWMTGKFQKFEANLTFAPPATQKGFLILKTDNPSGLPENESSLSISVRFQP